MITSQTPEQEELRYLASLISPKESDDRVVKTEPVKKPESLTDDNIIERLDHHGVTMVALQANVLSPSINQALQARKALAAASSELKTQTLIKVFNRFNKAGLAKCLLFKGTALAHTHYPEPWVRPSSDSDCLISPDDRLKFEKAFQKLKFKKLFAIEGELVSYQSTYSRVLTGEVALNIDLHWRINNRQILAKAYDLIELSERGTSIASLNHCVLLPSAVDSIIISSLHRLGHHANDERLIWLYDIHLLANSLNEDDWEELCLLCEDKKLAAITLDALATCNDLLGTHIPEESHEVLKKLARRGEPSKVFLQRQLSEWQTFKQDIKALDGITSKAQLIKEHAFPNRDYIEEQMGTDNLLKGHGKRLFRGMKRAIKKPN